MLGEQLVVHFVDKVSQDSSLTGGKGANLSRMVSADLPVPPGFVVTTNVFNRLASELVIASTKSLMGVPATESDTLQKVSDAIRRSILDIQFPEEIVNAIADAYGVLGSDTVSVRSSATAEDLANASFAGQYSSYINVLSLGDVMRYIRKVWASLYTPHAIAYRIENNIDDSNVSMAVVVQTQLQPDTSGVMFTHDPVTGVDRFVINAALGQGAGVVDGTVTPDQFTLDSKSGDLIESAVADKAMMVIASSGGGISAIAVPEHKRYLPSLSGSDLSKLFDTAKQVVAFFGSDQDIEFAIVDGELFLLQARPITTGRESDTSAVEWDLGEDSGYGWILHHLLSSRGPLYELQRDMARFYTEQQRVCFEETGSAFNRNHITTIVNGYVYGRSPEIAPDVLAERQGRQGDKWNAYASQGTSLYEAHHKPLIDDVVSKLRAQKRLANDFVKSVEYMQSTMEAWGYVLGHLHWCQMKPGPPADWPTMFHEITGESSENAVVFLQAIPNKTTQLTARLRDLARIVQSDSELSAMFKNRDYQRLNAADFADNQQVQLFNRSFKNLLREFGQRTGWSFGSSANFLSPTWNMNTTLPLDSIAAYAEQNIDRLEQLEAAALRERQNATRRIRRRLASDPDQLAQFNAGLSIAINTVKTMENHNHMMEQVTTGTMREAVNEVGRHLVIKGLLDDPDDVFHLSVDEIRQIAKGNTDTEIRTLVASRAEEWEARAQLSAPPTLGDGPLPENRFGGMHDLPEGVGLNGDVLKGVPASRGRITGPARIALEGQPLPQVHPGDILVAENAGAEWTPVMSILGGIVLNRGAVFQHAALVAREYRIPAVLMTGDATSVIEEGQIITVDGDDGLVELGG